VPAAAHRECQYPRCPNYATSGSYCEDHRRAPAHDRTYGGLNNANKRFRWLRQAWLMRHPVCAHCGELGNVLDHIIPHRGIANLFWSPANWQTLCGKCHGKKTRQEIWGQ
jgi:5-methylcytosine-specific restriction protein A